MAVISNNFLKIVFDCFNALADCQKVPGEKS